jgi:hypothetical protein
VEERGRVERRNREEREKKERGEGSDWRKCERKREDR